MEENQKKSIELVIDITKSFIGFALGLAGFTITFSKEILKWEMALDYKHYLYGVWLASCFSVCFGCFTIMALIGELAQNKNAGETPLIYKQKVRFFSVMQIMLLLGTLALLVFFIIQSSWS